MPPPITPAYITAFANKVLNDNGAVGQDVWDTIVDTGGTASIDSTINRRSGGFSLKFSKSATVNSVYRRKTFNTGSNKATTRLYFYFEKIANNIRFHGVDDSSAVSDGLNFRVNGSNLQMISGGYTSPVSNKNIITGTWYRLEYNIDISANPYTINWSIDGEPEAQWKITGSVSTLNRIFFGNPTAVTGSAVLFFTDVVMCQNLTDYPIGAGNGWALLPNRTITGSWQTQTAFRNNDMTNIDANSWNRLDEWTPSTGSTSDYVKQITTTGQTGTIVFGMQPRQDSGQGVINGVEAYIAYTSSGTAANNAGCIVRRLDGTEVTVFGSKASPADYSDGSINSWWFARAVVTAPTGSWTTNEINNLEFRFGYSTDVSPQPFLGALLLEYDVGVPAPQRAAVVG